MDRLMVVGRRVAVVHQGEIHEDAVTETLQFEIPVEPPARKLTPKKDHEQWAKEQRRAGAVRDYTTVVRRKVSAGDTLEHHDDGDRDEDPQCRRHTVERSIRVVDVELDGIRSRLNR